MRHRIKSILYYASILIVLLWQISVLPRVYAAAPISGTFVVPDLFYTSEDQYRQFFQELQDSGFNVIILTLTGILTKDCQTGAYREEIATRLQAGNPPFIPIAIKLAKAFSMKVYFAVADYTQVSCFIFHQGDATSENTDKGKLIAFSLRTMDAIKQTVSAAGISWNDPIIAGFYITPEVNTRYLSQLDYPQIQFFKELSNRIKQKEPAKKIMLSPFQYEDVDYAMSKQAYTNLFSQTSIDIVAPQDSMGTGVTRTYARSSDHFRALRDAVTQFPGREAWANIESFTAGSDAFVHYIPTSISKLTQQVAAASPYVSRMITWIYSHTMLSNPLSDNMAAVNIYASQYTPENASKRKALRRDYLSYYGMAVPTQNITGTCTPLYYYHTISKSCINTSNIYNENQQDCNGSLTLCSTNLQTYLAGKTTGICYQTLASCKLANTIVSQTPTYTKTPTPTSIAQYIPVTPTPIVSAQKKNGDFTGDGNVDSTDYELLRSRFGHPYSIFDYSLLIEYFQL